MSENKKVVIPSEPIVSPELQEYFDSIDKEIILSTKNLGIRFGGLHAVEAFSIDIKAGELVGLIGPNGAGKTTIFNLLTGVYKPTEGDIFLCGERLNGKTPHQIVKAGISRTFQNIRLFKDMSVIENVMTGFSKDIPYNLFDTFFRTPAYWRLENAMRARALVLLELFGLQDKAELMASQLTYGQQRKLEIARALATGMKVLLLDEPAAGMNPTETADLLKCIKRIREEFGIAILLIEHDMSLVMNVCERIQVINFGRTIAKGLPHEIATNRDVIEAYLGREE